MKVVALVCSARRGGNCEEIAERVLGILGGRGVETEMVRLIDYDIHPCNRCDYQCFREEEVCPIEDDVPLIWEKLRRADGVVIATPSYYGFLPATFKAVIERAQGILNWVTVEFRDLEAVWRGKPTLVIAVSDGGGEFILQYLRETLKGAHIISEHLSYTELGIPGYLGGLLRLPQASSRVEEMAEKLYERLSASKDLSGDDDP
ncbi:MAG: Multimeric flavodoxin (WrbA) domain containing protein [Candidatus Bathyarchaeota archaeon B23]|nr:MAG: Multimeric flavodoxin (WrbA) domain containing protein [Candidatus Bathyarchaeota archaeon B23]